MTPPPFFSAGPACDDYRRYLYATHPYTKARDFIEDLWREVHAYLDPDFLEKAKEDFPARFWEMYLAAAVLRNRLELVPRSSSNCPDLEVVQPRCFLEAVTARSGVGPDAVPAMVMNKGQDVPHEQIILRLTNAIVEKFRKYQGYLNSGLLTAADPYIIAISASEIGFAITEPMSPYIVSAVLPFGEYFVTLDLATRTAVGGGFEHRPQITKASGSPVSTTIFQDPTYQGISAVIYSRVDPINRPRSMGADFILVHNPLASSRLPRGTFRFGREYWFDAGVQHHVDHVYGLEKLRRWVHVRMSKVLVWFL